MGSVKGVAKVVAEMSGPAGERGVLLSSMRLLPERINAAWISTLADEDLLDIETRLYDRFTALDTRHKRLRGGAYNLMRGPTELIDAWDRWSRVSVATRTRSLVPRRPSAGPAQD